MNNSLKFRAIKLIPLLFLFLSIETNLHAQSSKTSELNIYSLDSYITSVSKNSDLATRLKKLVYELNSSIYFYEGNTKIFGENPACLFTDINGFNNLSKQDMPKKEIELITIRVENIQDFKSNIDFKNISAFPKLKYIYILITFDYNINSIPKNIINNNDSHVVVFKSEKGA